MIISIDLERIKIFLGTYFNILYWNFHTGTEEHHNKLHKLWGRAMAQAVSRRPPTVEARARSRVSPYGICGGQSGTGTGFSPSTSVFPCQLHSTVAPLLGKMKKPNHLPLHLHHKGCRISPKAAVRP
jgi:hypothetical protein